MANAKDAKNTVKIRIPLTKTEKDDVFVGVNGKTYLIKRGVEVEVPKVVADILAHTSHCIMGFAQVGIHCFVSSVSKTPYYLDSTSPLIFS